MRFKFKPNYTVSYKGVFHPAGKVFDIEEADAAEMSKHGSVQEPIRAAPEESDKSENESSAPEDASDEKSVRKAGRPRKVSA